MRFKLPAFEKKFFWIGFILLIKFIFLFVYYANFYPVKGMEGLVFTNKDFEEFYLPIEHFIEQGHYSLNGTTPYAERTPGYVFPAMLFRIFFDKCITLHLTILFQLVVSSFAAYTMAITLFNLRKSAFVFWLSIGIFTFASYWVNFDVTFHPGSLCISTYVLAMCFFYRFTNEGKFRSLFASGFFLAWCIFLRPFIGIYLLSFSFILLCWIIHSRKKLKFAVLSFFIFLLPLALMESIWVFRNYLALNRFVPMQTAFVGGERAFENDYLRHDKYSLQKLRDLIFAWGGDNLWYINTSEMYWFTESNQLSRPPFSSSVYCSAYNADSLMQLRNAVIGSFKTDLSKSAHDSLEEFIISRSFTYSQAFKKEKKMHYYLLSPLVRIKHLAFRNVVMDWPGPSFRESGLFYKILKIMCNLVYFVLLALGGLSLISGMFSNKFKSDPLFFLSALNLLALLATFAYFINFAHHTYFFTGFISAVFLLFSSGLNAKIFMFLRGLKRPPGQ